MNDSLGLWCQPEMSESIESTNTGVIITLFPLVSLFIPLFILARGWNQKRTTCCFLSPEIEKGLPRKPQFLILARDTVSLQALFISFIIDTWLQKKKRYRLINRQKTSKERKKSDGRAARDHGSSYLLEDRLVVIYIVHSDYDLCSGWQSLRSTWGIVIYCCNV